MKTTATLNMHIHADADIHGTTGRSSLGDQYACTLIGESMLFFWDKGQLEALRDLCNKQLEEWK